MTEFVQASKFKAKCLKLMDNVHRTKRRIIITKRNKPIAQLVPIDEKSESLFGKMKGTIHVVGDIMAPDSRAHLVGNIMAPIDEMWDADR